MVDFGQIGSILGGVLSNYSENSAQNAEIMDHNQVYDHYKQAVQTAPQEVTQAHQEYYQQMPQPQRQNLMSEMLSALQQHGVDPNQAGINNTEATPSNLAQVSNYVSQNPNLLDKIFGPGGTLSSPLAKVAMVGALGYLASRMSHG